MKKLIKSPDFKIFKIIVAHYLAWIAAIYFIAYLGLSVLPTYNFYEKIYIPPHSGIDFWQRWGNWDGSGYRYIAEHGYTSFLTVFFPLYPLLIRILLNFGINSLFGGILVSQVSALIALFFMYKLILIDFDQKTAVRSIRALLVFPASFYMLTVYSDALALAVSLIGIYFIRRNQYLKGSLFSGLALATRLVGVAAILASSTEYLIAPKFKFEFSYFIKSKLGRFFCYLLVIYILLNGFILFLIFDSNSVIPGIIISILPINFLLIIFCLISILIQKYKILSKLIIFRKILTLPFFYLLISVLPLIAFLIYQQIAFGSFINFLGHEETMWGRRLSFPWEAPIYTLRLVLTNIFTTNELIAHMYTRLVFLLLNLVVFIYAFSKLRLSYLIYFFVTMLIPLLSGSLGDIMRFSLTNYPLFIAIGLIKNDFILQSYYFVSILLLSIFIVLFINNYFFI